MAVATAVVVISMFVFDRSFLFLVDGEHKMMGEVLDSEARMNESCNCGCLSCWFACACTT